jgi:hypothetical protein
LLPQIEAPLEDFCRYSPNLLDSGSVELYPLAALNPIAPRQLENYPVILHSY